MYINIGFICSTSDNSLSTNHSIKLANLNKENVINCVKKNLADFIKLLDLSKKIGCKTFRLGSEFIPFASHPKFNKSWFKDISEIIKVYEPVVNKFKIRISMHPGQFVVLNSKKRYVLKRSLKELEYHFWLLEQFNMDENSIVVIHGGGTYGNKEKSIEKLHKEINKNAWLKERISIENDEKSFSAIDVIMLCKKIEVPFVFDYFHHKINPSYFEFNDIFDLWGSKIPEFHLSSKSENKKNKFSHGEYVNLNDFLELRDMILKNYKKRVDIMIEAKKKEIAVIKLLNNLKNQSFYNID